MRVCLGGTFEFLHAGHQQLLRTALDLAGPDGSLLIGLTTDAFLTTKGTHSSYPDRLAALTAFLKKQDTTATVRIIPLNDAYGPAVDADLDIIVVSPETRPAAEQINRLRQQRGKPRLQIVEVPFVLAADGRPISSTRIRRHEILPDGTLRRHG